MIVPAKKRKSFGFSEQLNSKSNFPYFLAPP